MLTTSLFFFHLTWVVFYWLIITKAIYTIKVNNFFSSIMRVVIARINNKLRLPTPQSILKLILNLQSK